MKKPKGKTERVVRLQLMLLEDELAVIETFRFQNRMPSRAAAVRELMRRGLKAEGFDIEVSTRASTDYGVED